MARKKQNAVVSQENTTPTTQKATKKPKPTAKPATKPVAKPSAKPVAKPTAKPSAKPVAKPSTKPVAKPTAKPSAKPVAKPSVKPVAKPSEPTPVVDTVQEQVVLEQPEQARPIAQPVTTQSNGQIVIQKTKMQKSRSDVIFDTVNYILLSLMLVVFLYPLIYVVSASFSKPSDVITGNMWLLPTSISLEGYARILSYAPLWKGFLNTIFVVVIGTIISLVITMLAGYVLSREDFKARTFFIWIFTITMFFGGGLIPTYMLVSETLNLRDSLWSLIIPSAISVWNIILVKTYFSSSLPKDILEAAQIDGCGDFKFFILIAVPLAIPIIAVIALYNVVGKWNSYFDAMIYLSSPDKYPLQLVINNLLIENDVNSLGSSGGSLDLEHQMMVESMKYGVIVIASLPMLVVYPMVQQYFIKGIMVGSVKG